MPEPHPEYLCQSSSGWIGPKRISPYTVDELLRMPAKNCAKKLADFHQTPGENNPNWLGLQDNVESASQKNPQWGYNLAEEFIRTGNAAPPLWGALLAGWPISSQEDKQYAMMLSILDSPVLHKDYSGKISCILNKLSETDNATQLIKNLPKLFDIAKKIWGMLDHERENNSVCDWHHEAINHPSGKLTQFLVNSLQALHQTRAKPISIDASECSEFVTSIITEDSYIGRCSRSILASNLKLLFSIDDKWVKEELIKYFVFDDETKEQADFLAVWDGLLCAKRCGMSPEVAKILKGSMMNGMRYFLSYHTGKRVENFMDCYLCMIASTLKEEDIRKKWLIAVFECDEGKNIKTFFSAIIDILEHGSDNVHLECWEHFIKPYMKYRFVFQSSRLSGEEMCSFLRVICHLRCCFSRAVELLTSEGHNVKSWLCSHLLTSSETGDDGLHKQFSRLRSLLEIDHENLAKFIIYVYSDKMHESTSYAASELFGIIKELKEKDFSDETIPGQLSNIGEIAVGV